MISPHPPPAPDTATTIAFVAYPGLTLLDLVGPLQVCTMLSTFVPAVSTAVIAESTASVPTDTVSAIVPSHTFDQLGEPDVLVVPGGLQATLAAMADEKLLARLRHSAQHAQVVASVCTGSLLLGAAGLLKGRRASTLWMFRDVLAKFGATPVAERWVLDGQYLTSAGVSAGIDMALHLVQRLAGEEVARLVQLAIEYDPRPPLDIDWAPERTASFKGIAAAALEEALVDRNPELLARLTS